MLAIVGVVVALAPAPRPPGEAQASAPVGYATVQPILAQRCYTCHADNTAVEQTFVQFYPELMEVAKKMGTVKTSWKEGAPIR